MTQHVAVKNEPTQISPVKHENYDALDAAIGSDIDGDPIRFKDGKWVA